MRVSVIIPYYNPDSDLLVQQLLTRAVTSAWESMNGVCDCQIVVVNDGSPAIPDSVLPAHIPVDSITIPHRMLGGARNAGMDIATGDIILFLDADDMYVPGALAPCVKAMESMDADVVAFGIKRIKGNRPVPACSSAKPVFSAPVSGESYMSSRNFPACAWRYMIRAQFLKEHNLRFVENAYIEDEEFTPRMLHLARSFSETTLPVYAYCIRQGSIITDNSKERIEARSAHTLQAISSLLAFREQHSGQPHRGLDRKISYLAMDHLRRTLRRDDWLTAVPAQKSALEQMGLFPFQGGYSLSFRFFSRLSRCKAGTALLHLIESFYK